jgi:hypothetical protein
MSTYQVFLALHSLLRWVVLILAIVAVVRAIVGMSGPRAWARGDTLAGRLLTISVDTQLLVGLILYGVLSPVTRMAFSDMGVAMRDASLRFYAVEHLVLMLAAVALVHVGQVRVRKAMTDRARHRTAAVFFGLALLLMIVGIPWPFRAVGRPLLPF